MGIVIKSEAELARMRGAGDIVRAVLDAVEAACVPGATTAQLEQIAARLPAAHFPAAARYDDASWVGYRLAELLPLPLSIRQRMLEVSDASVRLAALRQFMERQGLV